MFSKEEDLKKIDSAYPRIVISAGEYETEEFTKILDKKSRTSHISLGKSGRKADCMAFSAGIPYAAPPV